MEVIAMILVKNQERSSQKLGTLWYMIITALSRHICFCLLHGLNAFCISCHKLHRFTATAVPVSASASASVASDLIWSDLTRSGQVKTNSVHKHVFGTHSPQGEILVTRKKSILPVAPLWGAPFGEGLKLYAWMPDKSMQCGPVTGQQAGFATHGMTNY